MDGYKKMFNDTLVTVWSAPNYCYRCGNVAAILELNDKLDANYKKFEAASHETRGVPAKKPAPEYFLWIIHKIEKLIYESLNLIIKLKCKTNFLLL